MERFKTKQEEVDYWAMIETAAKGGEEPNHDCGNIGGEPQGCQVCEDYHESRAWWAKYSEEQSNKFNQKLL